MTKVGHYLTKHLLKIPQDATGAFRYYRISDIPKNLFLEIKSDGYSFFYESLFIFNKNKIDISEMAISLPARVYGSSKMGYRDILNSYIFLWLLFVKNLITANRKKNNKY